MEPTSDCLLALSQSMPHSQLIALPLCPSLQVQRVLTRVPCACTQILTAVSGYLACGTHLSSLRPCVTCTCRQFLSELHKSILQGNLSVELTAFHVPPPPRYTHICTVLYKAY